MQCLNIPELGAACLHDLKIQLGTMHVDLAHPGVAVAAMLLGVMGVFIFRSPA